MILLCPPTGWNLLIPAAISSAPMPSPAATATAARAFVTICIPGTGTWSAILLSPATASKYVPSSPFCTIFSAYTLQLLPVPKNTGLFPFASFIWINLSSSPLRYTIPLSAIDEKISVLALSTPSLSPRFSRWHCPILVIIHISGFTILESLVISPNSLMPISTTAISCSSRRRNNVRGTPTSLLKLPCVFNVLKCSESTEATISFVVVLPTLPVIPIILVPQAVR